MLTDTQKCFYRENGFLVLRGVLSDAELAELREAAGRLRDEQERGSGGEPLTVIQDIILKDEAFMTTARHPVFLAAVTDLIGPDPEMLRCEVHWTPPGTGERLWHQDFSSVPHSRRDWLTGMFLLDDATPETGCRRVIEGSHKAGSIDPGDGTHEDETFDLVARAGDVTLHHCCLMYCAYPNHSPNPHRSFTCAVRPAKEGAKRGRSSDE